MGYEGLRVLAFLSSEIAVPYGAFFQSVGRALGLGLDSRLLANRFEIL